MRSRMIIMVALLAVAGVMAAMAYTSATVTNSATVKISNTNEALLALGCYDGPNSGHKDGTCSTESGRLSLDFTKGLTGSNYGMQRGSEYMFDDLFWVKNNSNDRISVTITYPDLAPPVSVSVTLSETSFELAPGVQKYIDVTSKIGNDAPIFNGTVDFTVTVAAVAIP